MKILNRVFYQNFKLHTKVFFFSFQNFKVQIGLVTFVQDQENVKWFQLHSELSADSLQLILNLNLHLNLNFMFQVQLPVNLLSFLTILSYPALIRQIRP